MKLSVMIVVTPCAAPVNHAPPAPSRVRRARVWRGWVYKKVKSINIVLQRNMRRGGEVAVPYKVHSSLGWW